VCACRDGNVHSIKESGPSGIVIELESMPCGLVRIDKSILVGCMSNAVHSFSLRGKKQYSLYLPDPISCMELLQLSKTRTAKALIVGMASGEVRLYNDKHLVASLRISEPVTALRFGCYGREEGCLAIVGASGSLSIKILQRTAKFEASGQGAGPPPEQDVPLSIPKKTKLYVEQTQREREQATEMHRAFQRDLCKLRLSTARAYVKMITDGNGPMSYASGSALRLTAQVQGLGPRFKIKLALQNTGSKAVQDLCVCLNYNALLYRVKAAVFNVPVLVPGLSHRIDAELECVDENGGADVVKVYVCPVKSLVPILSALVNMPAAEMLLGTSLS
jgi:Bardet-Biedl syndrome 1 protein